MKFAFNNFVAYLAKLYVYREACCGIMGGCDFQKVNRWVFCVRICVQWTFHVSCEVWSTEQAGQAMLLRLLLLFITLKNVPSQEYWQNTEFFPTLDIVSFFLTSDDYVNKKIIVLLFYIFQQLFHVCLSFFKGYLLPQH